MPERDIFVVGGSAGALEALQILVRQLPADFPGAIFVVLHVASESPSSLPAILKRNGPLPAVHATDREAIRPGRIYIAPPDYHLLVHRSHVRVVRGPRENRNRPAIDPLFRTAARAYGNRVVGVILSGLLDDGSAGLATIKRHGGTAVVQDPQEAIYGEMPASALQSVEADYVVPAADLAATLISVAAKPALETVPAAASTHVAKEDRITEFYLDAMEDPDRPGTPSVFTCPECNGVLWEVPELGGPMRFRCRVGHAYTGGTLLAEKVHSYEGALWEALRALEESANLAHRMARSARAANNLRSAERFEQQAENKEQHAGALRAMLLENENQVPAPEVKDAGIEQVS